MQYNLALQSAWERFIDLLSAQSSELLEHIRPPATRPALAEAEQRLQCTLPEELQQLYLLADGFRAGVCVLRDEYRLLPIDEMVEASLALVGEPASAGCSAGQHSEARRVIRLVVLQTKEDDPNAVKVSVRLWPKRQPTVEIQYRAGGTHDVEEVLHTQGSLTAWLEDCLEYPPERSQAR